QSRMESNGILGHRAAGLGGGLQGGGERRGALMGLGMPVNPAADPQEALACGLALGRAAAATVRWADRLRRGRPSPCGVPSTHPHHLLVNRCSGFGGATSCAAANKDYFSKGPTCVWVRSFTSGL
ncbi:unnamed protein product, partial [Tetraodon nigroviridis]